MTIRVDPEGHEVEALFDMADLRGRNVLEIGCGDGRLTMRYADRAAHVTAIDPFGDSIERAEESLPDALADRVDFHHVAFEDFQGEGERHPPDVTILSWSL
ncbi:MAG TPA: class I SAM-dependent methyltransferase [Actinomycetota bacterium]|nr:class I SAM-dependent methyltransferase [Actinomycetota bacterium]